MALAKIIECGKGLKTNRVYAKSKTGNVYIYKREFAGREAAYLLMYKVREAGVIRTQHWRKIA